MSFPRWVSASSVDSVIYLELTKLGKKGIGDRWGDGEGALPEVAGLG